MLTTLDLPSGRIEDAKGWPANEGDTLWIVGDRERAHIQVTGIPPSLLGTVPEGLAVLSCTTGDLADTLQHRAADSADAFIRFAGPMAGVGAAIGVVNGAAVEFMQTGR